MASPMGTMEVEPSMRGKFSRVKVKLAGSSGPLSEVGSVGVSVETSVGASVDVGGVSFPPGVQAASSVASSKTETISARTFFIISSPF